MQAILWSSLFKHHLELGHGEEAYDAMMGNPDPVRWGLPYRHCPLYCTPLTQVSPSLSIVPPWLKYPPLSRKSECLRRLVVVLTEQRRLKELCDFTYSGLEEEVIFCLFSWRYGNHCPTVVLQIEKVIELRARTVDVTGHSYYDLLYCFHTSRGNHRKGDDYSQPVFWAFYRLCVRFSLQLPMWCMSMAWGWVGRPRAQSHCTNRSD